MQFILELMDLNAALATSLGWARKQRGHNARVSGLVFLLLCVPLGWLCWYFDIESTLIFTNKLGTDMLATASASVLIYAQLVLLLIAAAPTMIRMTFSPLAASGFKLAGVMVFVVGLLDARTDWPRVHDWCDSVWYLFEPMGLFGPATWYAFRLIWMFLATDGFEILFVTTLACGVVLLLNSRTSAPVPVKP